jgi:mRNA interferase RelE/StbE
VKQPRYRLRIPDTVAELIRGMHPLLKKKVKAGLAAVASDPDSGKALKEELEGLRSFRIGKFRIIYRTAGRTVEIVAVGPRRIIYQETHRLLIRGK